MLWSQLQRNRRFVVNLVLVFGLLLQSFTPFLDRGPGYLREAKAQEDENGDAENFIDTLNFWGVPSAEPFEFPKDATSLTDMLTPQDGVGVVLPQMQVETARMVGDEPVRRVGLSPEGGIAQIDDQTLLAVDRDSMPAGTVVELGPVVAPDQQLVYLAHLPLIGGGAEPTDVAETASVVAEWQDPEIAAAAEALATALTDADNAAATARMQMLAETSSEDGAEDDAEPPTDVEEEPLDDDVEIPDMQEEDDAAPVDDDEILADQLTDAPPLEVVSDTIDMPGVLDGMSETVLEFNVSVDVPEDAAEANEIGTVHLAFDVRDEVPEGTHIWSVQASPVDDAAASIAPAVVTYDDNGLLSVELEDVDTSSSWNVTVTRVGEETEPELEAGAAADGATATRSSAGGEAPGPWKPAFNAPTVSSFSGAASYSYPIGLPPGRGGLTPNLGLSYSSSSLRGMMINKTLNQGDIGTGWSMGLSEIVRDATTQRPDGTLEHGEQFSIVLNGQNHSLMPVGEAGRVREYRAIGNPALRIQQFTDSPSNRDGLYWQVTSADGTIYRMGYTQDAEVGQEYWDRRRSVTMVNDPLYPTYWAKGGKLTYYSALKWRVDTVTDLRGNQIQYDYYLYKVDEPHFTNVYDARPTQIRYNYANRASHANMRVTGRYASKIDFARHDIYHDGTEDTYRFIREIKIYHLEFSRPLRTIKLDREIFARDNNTLGRCHFNTGDWNAPSITVKLNRIQAYDYAGRAEPPVTFDYRPFNHGTGTYASCYLYFYLTGVRGELGGYTRFTYEDDQMGYAQQSTGSATIVRSWYVKHIDQYDGITGHFANNRSYGQYARVTYDYSGPCYNYEGRVDNKGGRFAGTNTICQSQRQLNSHFGAGSGKLAGFAHVWASTIDYDGSLVNRSYTKSAVVGYQPGGALNGYQEQLIFGQPLTTGLYDETNRLLSYSVNTYDVQRNERNQTIAFRPNTQTCTHVLAAVQGSTVTQCQKQYYETGAQANQQLGQVTRSVQVGDIGGQVNRRVETVTYYQFDSNRWLIQPRYTGLYDNGTAVSKSWTYYQHWWTDQNIGLPKKVIQLFEDKDRYGRARYVVTNRTYYDAYGNPRYVYDARGKRTTTVYDGLYNMYPVKVVNPLGHAETFQYRYINTLPWYNDGAPGTLRRHITANNVWTYYYYDSRGRLIRSFNNKNGSWRYPNATYAYADAIVDRYGRLTRVPWTINWTLTGSNATPWSQGGTWTREFYDGLGRTIQTQTPDQNWRIYGSGATGTRIVMDTTYNALGQAVAQSLPYGVAADRDTRDWNIYVQPNRSVAKTITRYDAAGNAVFTQDVNGNTAETIAGNRSTWVRDGRGYLSASYTDDAGQLIAVDELLAAATPSWTRSGSVSMSGDTVWVNGTGSWATRASQQLTQRSPDATQAGRSGVDNTAVQMRLKATSGTESVIYIAKGSWATSSYHRLGIYLRNNKLYDDTYQAGTLRARNELMTLKPNVEYQLAIRAGQRDNEWRVLVWEVGNAGQRAEFVVNNPSASWKGGSWVLNAHARVGQVTLQDYRAYTVERTHYAYDGAGNLTTVTNPYGHTTTMTYNEAGHKLSMDDPDMGVWSYAYDNVGNLIQQTDAKNQTLRFTYDALGRMLSNHTSNGTPIAKYAYDGAGIQSRGQRTSMVAYTGTRQHNKASWAYDALGRVASETRTFYTESNVSYTWRFAYSEGGLPTTTTYPDRERVTTSYNWVTGRPTSLGSNGNSRTYVQGIAYNVAGSMTGLTYGNGQQVHYSYDIGNRLTKIDPFNANLPDLTYTYDANSNVASIREGATLNQTQTFTYDSLNRLTQGRTTGARLGSYSNTMTYDALGNILTKDGKTYGYGRAGQGVATNSNKPIHAVTHLSGRSDFAYDQNGNMTRRVSNGKTWTQTWTIDNMLSTATAGSDNVQLYYDADNNMVLRTENNGNRRTINLSDGLFQRTYVGNNPNSALETSKRYFFNGQTVADRNGNNVYFSLSDHLGSPVASFGGTGGMSVYRRDAWGKKRDGSGTLRSDYLFTGQRWDERLGLYDYNARYYDAETGRFISADTIIPEPDRPISFNRFAYVANNPIRLSDPSGHTWRDEIQDFGKGAISEFVKNVGVGPSAQALAAGPNESSAMTGGRLVGALASSALGVAEMISGAGLIGGGGAVAGGGTAGSGGTLAVPAIGAGAGMVALGAGMVAHGAWTTVEGLMSAGEHASELISFTKGSNESAPNWRSVPTFGHTFRRHGQGAKNTRNLQGRAAGTGTPQGQWLDNDIAAQFLEKYLGNNSGKASTLDVEIPTDMGQLIDADGTIIPAEFARIVLKKDGTIRSAFPIPRAALKNLE